MIDPIIEMASPNELKLSIPFTQYVRPKGYKRIMRFDVLGDLAVAAKKVMDAGLQFECEVLSTDEVSLTVMDDDIDEDIAIEVVPNGPEVTKAVNRLILSAAEYVANADLEGEKE